MTPEVVGPLLASAKEWLRVLRLAADTPGRHEGGRPAGSGCSDHLAKTGTLARERVQRALTDLGNPQERQERPSNISSGTALLYHDALTALWKVCYEDSVVIEETLGELNRLRLKDSASHQLHAGFDGPPLDDMLAELRSKLEWAVGVLETPLDPRDEREFHQSIPGSPDPSGGAPQTSMPSCPGAPGDWSPPRFGGRLRFNDGTLAVTLDGKSHVVSPEAFCVLQALAKASLGETLTDKDLSARIPGMHGKKVRRDILKELPTPLKQIVRSRSGTGKWIQLPPLSESSQSTPELPPKAP